MLWNKCTLFTFKIICNIILSITKKTARIWKFGIVDDGSTSPTTASLFWFYYSGFAKYPFITAIVIIQKLLSY